MARWILILLMFFSSPAAYAGVQINGVMLDPAGQIRPALLSAGLRAWRDHPNADRDVLALVDFTKPSVEPRFYILDLKTGAVEAYRTAHGKGSDPEHLGHARTFSNVANSNASSLGAYRARGAYEGKHGLSLALDGLDPSNSNARARAIVLHAADYMTAAFIAAHAQPGRSWGCFVVAPSQIAHVVDRLKNGALIYAGA
jgi:hypothetical protein